jgi:SAM-dependent methyltransferase
MMDVLELGPGSGYTAWRIHKTAFSTAVIDYSVDAALQLRKALPQNIQVVTADICIRSLARNFHRTFDVAIALDVFESLTCPQIALENLSDVLGINGTLFLTFPNSEHCPNNYQEARDIFAQLRCAGFRKYRIHAVKLNPWAGFFFKWGHDKPLAWIRGNGGQKRDHAVTYESTWAFSNGNKLKRFRLLLHAYWYILRAVMAMNGPLYERSECVGSIRGKQLVVQAWK